VCYLVLCEASFAKKLAFAYLEDLQAEFHEQHGKKVPTVSRPYSFIEFGKREPGASEAPLLRAEKVQMHYRALLSCSCDDTFREAGVDKNLPFFSPHIPSSLQSRAPITLHYITCHLADAFIQSDFQ